MRHLMNESGRIAYEKQDFGEFVNAFHMFPAVFTTILFFASIAMNFIDKSRNYHKIIITLAIANGAIMIAAYLYKILNH